MKTILLLLITSFFVSCTFPWSSQQLIVRQVKMSSSKEGKYAVYFVQGSSDTDFVLYTDTNYKVGDTLK